jgi:hypothetical protein
LRVLQDANSQGVQQCASAGVAGLRTCRYVTATAAAVAVVSPSRRHC